MSHLLTIQEAATVLKISVRTLRRLMARRQVEVIKPAGLALVRITRAEVERLIQEGSVPTARYWQERRRAHLRSLP